MSLLRQGGGILAARLTQALANALTGWLIARVLGPTSQGHYSLLLLLIVVGAALLNGGMGLAAVPQLRSGRVRIGRMLKAQLTWLSAMFIVAIGLVSLLTVPWLAERIGLPLFTNWTLTEVVLATTGLMAFEIQLYDLLAVGRLHTGPVINMVRAFLHLLVLLMLMYLGDLHLGNALLIYAVSQILAAALLTVKLLEGRSAEPEPTESLPEQSISQLISYTLSRGWVGQLSAIGSVLHLRLDLLIVAWYHGPAAVGIYTVAVMAAELLWHLPGALQPLLVYSSSAQGDDGQRDQVTIRAIRLGLLSTAFGALIWLIFAGPVFRFFLQPEYAAAIPALQALLPGIVIFSAGSVLAGDFIGRGHPVWNTQASFLTVAVNVIAGLVLIPGYGVVGAAWASSIAYAVGSVAMLWRFSRETGYGLNTIFMK
jgi:O-antigen/teichoic acid export membrane protein